MGNKWSVKKAVQNVPDEGDYVLRIESVEPKIAKGNNRPYLMFKAVIVSQDEMDGKNANYMRSITPDSLWKLAGDVANANIVDMETAELPEEPDDLAKELDDLMAGKTFMFTCAHREYKGVTQADWTLVGPSSSL